jgi:hypothetical protein
MRYGETTAMAPGSERNRGEHGPSSQSDSGGIRYGQD